MHDLAVYFHFIRDTHMKYADFSIYMRDAFQEARILLIDDDFWRRL